MKTLLVLILGIAVGIGAVWYLQKPGSARPDPDQAAEDSDQPRDWRDRVGDLRGEEIREELARTGGVIRRKAREVGAYVTDATADARITGSIKSKLAVDEELSALSISVNTTDGVVTLSGRVTDYGHIGRAIDLAMKTDGVREVISTLQVSARRPEQQEAPERVSNNKL